MNRLSSMKQDSIKTHLKKYWVLYVMIIPGIIWFLIFRYIPIMGSVIAFKDYSIFKGITDSPWVGLKHFRALFEYPDFKRVFTNTIVLGVLKIGVLFPLPIILALMMNEVKNTFYKRTVQTIVYIPHFISWVIVASLAFNLLSIDGLVNDITGLFGIEPVLFMQKEKYFRWTYIFTGIWKGVGWGTIVYLAAIAGIDPSVYEAAKIDGASRVKQIIYVTVPLLIPTILTLFLLNIGKFMELGFDHVFNLLTPMTYSVGDIIDTYVFRVGIREMRYSYTTAVGLFQSIIGFGLVITFNKLSRKFSDGGLW